MIGLKRNISIIIIEYFSYFFNTEKEKWKNDEMFQKLYFESVWQLLNGIMTIVQFVENDIKMQYSIKKITIDDNIRPIKNEK